MLAGKFFPIFYRFSCLESYECKLSRILLNIHSAFNRKKGVLACTVESISYYPTVSQMCAAPPPPLHAINRGIGIEGLGTVLAGLFGSGNGTNTFGENVGAIGVTKVNLAFD